MPSEISPITAGHATALDLLENTEAYRETRALYASALGGTPVYLRPTEAGLTVVSLDPKAPKLLGVGGKADSTCSIDSMPPAEELVDKQIAEYEKKLDAAKKPEEQYSMKIVREALQDGLALPQEDLYFLHQDWRLGTARTRIDVLALNLKLKHLVVIELKRDEASALRGKKDAWTQASDYAARLSDDRQYFFPYFQRLARAMAVNHGGPEEMKTIELKDRSPRVLAGAPDCEWRTRR